MNYVNLTKSNGRMVTGGVPVRAIMAGLVLQWYCSWKRQLGCGGGNHHGAEVAFFLLCTTLYIERCKATTGTHHCISKFFFSDTLSVRCTVLFLDTFMAVPS